MILSQPNNRTLDFFGINYNIFISVTVDRGVDDFLQKS